MKPEDVVTEKEKTECSKSSEKALVMPSPYLLHPFDNPGSCISRVVLTGENYGEWAREMENSLRAKRKFGFVNGVIKQPTEVSEELEQWSTVNSMIVGWIRASVALKIRSMVTFTNDASKLWNDIQRRFSIGNTVHMHQLKAELASCRQNGLSVMDYFGKLSAKWEEFLNHKPIPTCSCDAREMILKEREEEQVHQFLMGLDDSRFGNVCTNIIGMEPLPDLNSIYQRLVREERRLGTSGTEHSRTEAVGFSVKTEQSQGGHALSINGVINAAVARAHDRTMVCHHCGRSGHKKEECWQLIGFPDLLNEKSQGRGRGDGAAHGRGAFSNARGRVRGQGQYFRSNIAQASVSSSGVSNFTAEQ